MAISSTPVDPQMAHSAPPRDDPTGCPHLSTLPGPCQPAPLCCVFHPTPRHVPLVTAQALNLFRRKTGTSRFFKVRLDKKVPHGEGKSGQERGVPWGMSMQPHSHH